MTASAQAMLCAPRVRGWLLHVLHDGQSCVWQSPDARACFRLLRRAVLSLGDSRSYYLTTAQNELGVVHARSAASGEALVPVSWKEMQCPKTGAVEPRKVAKTTS